MCGIDWTMKERKKGFFFFFFLIKMFKQDVFVMEVVFIVTILIRLILYTG
jgi:hypothetical protein